MRTVINAVWLAMILAGSAVYAAKGDMTLITHSLFQSAGQAVTFGIQLAGLIAFWSGIMKIAEESGLTRILARALRPLLGRLFPMSRSNDRVLGSLTLAISANILGLANASTALSLNAMEELQQLNGDKNRASDAMCTFVAFIMGGLTLVPATVIALRTQAGSRAPDRIIVPTVLISLFATTVALSADALFRRRASRKKRALS